MVSQSFLTRDELHRFLGPVPSWEGPREVQIHEEIVCDGFVRRHVSYAFPSGESRHVSGQHAFPSSNARSPAPFSRPCGTDHQPKDLITD